MDAGDILKVVKPEDLFGTGAAEQKKAFRKLVAQWHPDHNPDPKAGEVLARLMVLRDRLGSTDAGTSTAHVVMARKSGGEFRMNYIRAHKREVGALYVQKNSLTSVWPEDWKGLGAAEAGRLSAFRFADDRRKTQMERFLPKLKRREDLIEGMLIAVERRPGDILLADALAHLGKIPAEHAAWITSGLLNIGCWLEWSGLVHGAIGPDSVVIDPASHEVRLLGGWGFVTEVGTRPAALPGRTVDRCPQIAVKSSVAATVMDRELIRLTLCDMLRAWDRPGLVAAGVPAAIADWAIIAPPKTTYEDFKLWGDVLQKAYGKRKFVIWELKVEDVYQVT